VVWSSLLLEAHSLKAIHPSVSVDTQLTAALRSSVLSSFMEYCGHSLIWNNYLLGEGSSPSIGNTLWRVSVMFTRLAISPPEVNGFG